MVKRARAGGVLACLGVVIGVSVVNGTSLAGSSVSNGNHVDREATRRYLAAERTALVGSRGAMLLVYAAISRRVDSVERRCPAVASGAPRDPSRWLVEVGLAETLLVSAAQADRSVTARLEQTASRLRWTQPRITHLVHQELLAGDTLAHRKLPDICMSLQEWARDGFRRVPQTLKQFSREVAPFSEAPGVASVLARFERTDEKREVDRLRGLVAKELMASILSGRRRLLEVVGL